jgi:hypothetical protein
MVYSKISIYTSKSISAPPNSLKNSNVNPKVLAKEKKVKVCSLVHNISRVKKMCWNFGMGIRMSDKWFNHSHKPTQTKQQVGKCIVGTFLVYG